jgi:hypothetical protein
MSNNMSLGCIYSCCLSSFDPISAVILCVLCLQHFKLSDDLLTLSVCVCDFLRPIFLLSTLKEYKKVGLSILYFKKPFKNAERVCRVCGGGWHRQWNIEKRYGLAHSNQGRGPTPGPSPVTSHSTIPFSLSLPLLNWNVSIFGYFIFFKYLQNVWNVQVIRRSNRFCAAAIGEEIKEKFNA